MTVAIVMVEGVPVAVVPVELPTAAVDVGLAEIVGRFHINFRSDMLARF